MLHTDSARHRTERACVYVCSRGQGCGPCLGVAGGVRQRVSSTDGPSDETPPLMEDKNANLQYMYKSAAGGEQIYNQSYIRNAVIDMEQQANDTRSVKQFRILRRPEFSEPSDEESKRRYHLWLGRMAAMQRIRSHLAANQAT